MNRIELTLAGVAIEAAEGDVPSRTMTGLAVPFNVDAVVSTGQRVRFLPGSLPVDGPAPKVLLHHDRTKPVGVVTARVADPNGINVRARISATRGGDEALVLAADGVLDSWSVGADPVRYHHEGDVLVVEEARWGELSLLPFGAFAEAKVAEVHASKEDSLSTVTTDPATPVVAASDPTPPPTIQAQPTVVTAAPRRRSDLHAAAEVIAGLHGQAGAAEVRAALGALTTPDDPGLFLPAFIPEIKGLITYGRPLINAINSRALPPAGMIIEYPQWTDLPDVGQQATEKTAITTGTTAIAMKQATVLTWAGGNDISVQLAQRSNPSFMEAYLAAAAESYGRQTNGYVGTQLLAAATVVTAPVSPNNHFINFVQALFTGLDPTATPSGPLFLAVSWDIACTLIGVTELNGPAFWDLSIDLGGFIPDMSSGPESDTGVPAGGLVLFVDRQLASQTMLLGSRQAATWYEDPAAPATIRVVDVSLLGFDVGIYGFGALAVEYPKALTKITGASPVAAVEPATTSGRGSKS
jgi:HK97 family phage prohead protease